MKFTLFIIVFIQIITSCNNQNDTFEDLNNFHENRIFKIDNEVLIERIKQYVNYRKKFGPVFQSSDDYFVLTLQVRTNKDTVEYSLDYPNSVFDVFYRPPNLITNIDDDILVFIYTSINNDISFTDEYVIRIAKLAFPTQFEELINNEGISLTFSTAYSDLRLVFVSGELVFSKENCGPIYRIKNRKFPDRYVDPVSVDIAIERIVYTIKEDNKKLVSSDGGAIWSDFKGLFMTIFDYPHLHNELVKDFLLKIKKRPKPNLNIYNEKSNKDSLLDNDLHYAIAILSMQELDIDKYLELAKIGAELYYNKHISQYGFDYTFSGYKTDYVKISNIDKNKQNPKVMEFIKSVYNNPKTSEEFRDYIKKEYMRK
jgi:hypothetical protein